MGAYLKLSLVYVYRLDSWNMRSSFLSFDAILVVFVHKSNKFSLILRDTLDTAGLTEEARPFLGDRVQTLGCLSKVRLIFDRGHAVVYTNELVAVVVELIKLAAADGFDGGGTIGHLVEVSLALVNERVEFLDSLLNGFEVSSCDLTTLLVHDFKCLDASLI